MTPKTPKKILPRTRKKNKDPDLLLIIEVNVVATKRKEGMLC